MTDEPQGSVHPSADGPTAFPVGSGVAVTDGVYGAIDDGLRSYFVCTWIAGQPTLVAYLACLSVTVENAGPNGNAVLTFPDLSASHGISVGSEWCGKPIAIAGAGADGGIFSTTVVDFHYDVKNVPTLVLGAPAPEPLTNVAQHVSCPCFVPSDVGKSIWLSNAARGSAGSGNPTGPVMKRDIIADYVSPFQIALGSSINAESVTAQAGTQIVWGTDNSAAVRIAGKAALSSGRKEIYFPGRTRPASTGLFCLFDWLTNHAPAEADDLLASNVMGALHWFTSDWSTEVFVTSKTDARGSAANGRFQEAQCRKMAIPYYAPRRPQPNKEVMGGQSLRRCSTLSTIVAVVIGDSWALENSGGTNTTVLTRLKDEIQRQNPGKVVRWVYRGIGGYKWQDIVSPAIIPRSADLGWITGAQSYLHHIQNLAVPGFGVVTPDLIICMSGGANDGGNNGTIWPADLDTFCHIVAGWEKANGYPPDILMVNGATKTMEFFVFSSEYMSSQMEYVMGLNRSYARVNRIPFIDLATTSSFVTDGWAPDRHVLRAVPPLEQGKVSPSLPYSLRYQTRDFWVAFKLFGENGADVWSRIGTLGVQLSPKLDNRLLINVDRSGFLTVSATTWGGTIRTQVTIENGSASLITHGQVTQNVTSTTIQPSPPSYAIYSSSSHFSPDMVGQCFLAPGAMPGGHDFRSMVSGYTNAAVIFVSDGTPSGPAVTQFLIGGHMFTSRDASGQADVVLTSGDTIFATKIADYYSQSWVGLSDTWSGPSLSGAFVSLFVGRLSVLPTKDSNIAAGSDLGANPTITIEKRGTRVKVGYVLGSAPAFSDVHETLRHNERIVWEGDVACLGGPFIPCVWTSNATPETAVSIQAVYMMLGERELFLPELTMRDAWGVADNARSWPYGGDTSHPSSRWISRVVGDTIAAQDFATGFDFSRNFGAMTPAPGFDYMIPANQMFTSLTPEETLASGTIRLPDTFPQGGRLEVCSSQSIASLAVLAPPGFGIIGASVSTIAANGSIGYRLIGTTFHRVE